MEASIATRISRLQKMDLKELRVEYEKLFGKATKSRNRKQLFSQVSRKIQDNQAAKKTEGAPVKPILTVKFEPKRKGKGGSKKKKVAEKKPVKTRPIGQRDPRLPKIGTTISKKYKGKTINVRVLERGFEHDGRQFRSLSGVAKHITGSIWNGFLFFGLLRKGSKKS